MSKRQRKRRTTRKDVTEAVLFIMVFFALLASLTWATIASASDLNLMLGPAKSLEDSNAGAFTVAVESWRETDQPGHRRSVGVFGHHHTAQTRKGVDLEEYTAVSLAIGWEWRLFPERLSLPLYVRIRTSAGYVVGSDTVAAFLGGRHTFTQMLSLRLGRVEPIHIGHHSNFGTGSGGRNGSDNWWGINGVFFGAVARDPIRDTHELAAAVRRINGQAPL